MLNLWFSRGGNNLRVYREMCLMTQEELARKSKVCVRTISHIEAGRTNPRPSTKRKILNALGYDSTDVEKFWPIELGEANDNEPKPFQKEME